VTQQIKPDALTRMMTEHGQITEKAAFFRQALPVIKMGKNHDQINSFAAFLNEFIVSHFKYEEDAIFPRILERGDGQDIDFIRSLKADHVRILALVEDFFVKLDELLVQENPSLIESLSAKGVEIVTQTLQHAQTEDERLIPLVRIHFPGTMTSGTP